jgi:hypothetical protein
MEHQRPSAFLRFSPRRMLSLGLAVVAVWALAGIAGAPRGALLVGAIASALGGVLALAYVPARAEHRQREGQQSAATGDAETVQTDVLDAPGYRPDALPERQEEVEWWHTDPAGRRLLDGRTRRAMSLMSRGQSEAEIATRTGLPLADIAPTVRVGYRIVGRILTFPLVSADRRSGLKQLALRLAVLALSDLEEWGQDLTLGDLLLPFDDPQLDSWIESRDLRSRFNEPISGLNPSDRSALVALLLTGNEDFVQTP